MKIFITLFILLLMNGNNLLANNYPITDVTVYRIGATITRSGNFSLNRGDNIIELKGLANNINISTAQIIIDPKIKVLSVRSEQDNFINSEISQLNKLQDSLDWYKTEEKILNNQLATLEKNTKLSQNITGQYSRELEELMRYYKSETLRIYQDIFELSKIKKDLNNQINLLQSEGNRNMGEELVYRKKIVLKLSAPEAMNTDFSFSYFNNSAGWQTEYDLYMYDLDKDLSLVYKGKVYNNTQEDWKDVNLSLTTAKPNQNIRVPELDTWRLQVQPTLTGSRNNNNNYYIDGLRVKSNIRQEPMTMDEIGIADTEAPLAVYSEQFTATVFDVIDTHTILKNTPDYTIILSEQDIKSKYLYRCAPKLSSYAYLYAQVENGDELILSQGNLTVFAQGRMQGKTYIDPSANTDKFEIPLGVDYGIVVERSKNKEFSDIKFFKNRIKREIGYHIEIKNNKTRAIKIEIKDHVPISTIDLISVEDITLNGGDLNEETGEVSWTIDIDKNQKVERSLKYMVEYPKGANIGL